MSQVEIQAHMKTLGVDWGASADTVKRAWRNAAKRAHPDVSGDKTHERMAQINAAYDALKKGAPKAPAVKKQRAVKKRPRQRPVSMVIDIPTREKWRKIGEDFLANHNVKPSNDCLMTRLGLMKRKWRLYVPRSFKNYSSGLFEITIDAHSLPEGTNFLVFPVFKRDGARMVETGDHSVVEIEAKAYDTRLDMVPKPVLNSVMFPDDASARVVLSTALDKR